MYETIFAKLATTLNGITRVKESFNYPKTKIDSYPAVFYYPAGFENRFETGQENYTIYRFQIFVIVGVNQNITMAAASTVLSKAVQDIISAFADEWNMGTVDGHRMMVQVTSGDKWELSGEQDGLELSAPMVLEVKVLSDI